MEDYPDSPCTTALARYISTLFSFPLKRGVLCVFFYIARILLITALLFFGAASFGNAQTLSENELGYPIKAAFLYKFCLYIEWPSTAFNNSDSPIMLGVAGPDVVFDELSAAVKDRMISNRRLEVHRIHQSTDVANVHLLFVARSEVPLLRNIVAKLKNAPLLLVTEVDDGLDEGAGINFIVKDNKVRFDVALDTTTRQGLYLSAQLLKVARNVRGENSR